MSSPETRSNASRRSVVFLILALVGILAGVVWFTHWSPLLRAEQRLSEPREFSTLQIGEKRFEVVLSRTPEQIVQGLSDRQDIGAEGMMFLFSQPYQPGFWMYRMNFPLDFIWIANDTVVDLHENVPAVPFSTPQNEIPTVRPAQSVDAVVEVPAGFIQQQQIEKGQPATLDRVSEVRPWH
jgi:uncharacterized membrane protein (UPF0127 family)